MAAACSPTITLAGQRRRPASGAARASRSAAAAEVHTAGRWRLVSSMRSAPSPCEEGREAAAATQRASTASADRRRRRHARRLYARCRSLGRGESSAVSHSISESTRSGAVAAISMAISAADRGCPPHAPPARRWRRGAAKASAAKRGHAALLRRYPDRPRPQSPPRSTREAPLARCHGLAVPTGRRGGAKRSAASAPAAPAAALRRADGREAIVIVTNMGMPRSRGGRGEGASHDSRRTASARERPGNATQMASLTKSATTKGITPRKIRTIGTLTRQPAHDKNVEADRRCRQADADHDQHRDAEPDRQSPQAGIQAGVQRHHHGEEDRQGEEDHRDQFVHHRAKHDVGDKQRDQDAAGRQVLLADPHRQEIGRLRQRQKALNAAPQQDDENHRRGLGRCFHRLAQLAKQRLRCTKPTASVAITPTAALSVGVNTPAVDANSSR